MNWAVAEGQLQLNAFDPVMVHELLTGMALLTHAMETFRVNCVEGIEINADLGRSYAQSSPSISAALNHYIGYEHAADIAAEAVHTGRTVREVAGERTDLPAEHRAGIPYGTEINFAFRPDLIHLFDPETEKNLMY